MNAAPEPTINGHNGVGEYAPNGEAGPSGSDPFAATDGYAPGPSPYQLHNDEIINHLYNTGFQSGEYADTIMHVHQNTYRLHALLLSRSPYLAHLLSTSPPTGGQRVIFVRLEHEPEITPEGFAVALGYLYSATSVNLIHPGNARSILAAGCLLGGMADLCEYAYEACRQSITLDTIAPWLEFVNALTGLPGGGSASSSGVSTPVSPGPPPPPPMSVFGLYAERMREDVFDFLVVQLPSMLGVSAPPPGTPAAAPPPESAGGRDTLLQIFARTPFELFKSAVESPAFQIGSDQARFKFAKDAIELRKRGIARGLGAEETVVLAFGGASMGGSAVLVTRKMRKRPLWKVNS